MNPEPGTRKRLRPNQRRRAAHRVPAAESGEHHSRRTRPGTHQGRRPVTGSAAAREPAPVLMTRRLTDQIRNVEPRGSHVAARKPVLTHTRQDQAEDRRHALRAALRPRHHSFPCIDDNYRRKLAAKRPYLTGLGPPSVAEHETLEHRIPESALDSRQVQGWRGAHIGHFCAPPTDRTKGMASLQTGQRAFSRTSSVAQRDAGIGGWTLRAATSSCAPAAWAVASGSAVAFPAWPPVGVRPAG
jgi:hypothetical protein